MSETSQGNPIERAKVDNVRIFQLTTRHAIGSDREYSQVVQGVEKAGANFFSRGLKNIFYLEDGEGPFGSKVAEYNEASKALGWRGAFWRVHVNTSEESARATVRKFEGQPYSKFQQGLTTPDRNTPFVYAVFNGLDNLVRKGIQIEFSSGVPSNEAKMIPIPDFFRSPAERVAFWRSLASRVAKADVEMADDVSKIIDEKAQSRSRIMLLTGQLHDGLANHLPEELKLLVRVSQLLPGQTNMENEQLLRDIVSKDLSDDEILQRLAKR